MPAFDVDLPYCACTPYCKAPRPCMVHGRCAIGCVPTMASWRRSASRPRAAGRACDLSTLRARGILVEIAIYPAKERNLGWAGGRINKIQRENSSVERASADVCSISHSARCSSRIESATSKRSLAAKPPRSKITISGTSLCAARPRAGSAFALSMNCLMRQCPRCVRNPIPGRRPVHV
ncbi:uncharacterized protein K452DRAFT_138516 [Aplosporella prunicola CBS 121167]|uniref:Uncharacterized protein n=1 Tax=Aplosporella prunicola CBS 121167 TaxID=1176127 RepID=A0A6A6AYP8_9PEZI|nr:uncharacterized protein K452DRAFT_138516 [Aplosporella prunicola CBS 121167]KAF2136313.1 hypothetical protein K452DRAFT_138516 [Aplosporella prunicola CBS 121167]